MLGGEGCARILVTMGSTRKWAKKHFHVVQRARIESLQDQGYFERTFSVKVCYSKTALHSAASNFTNFGIYGNKRRTARPRLTSTGDNFRMKLYFLCWCMYLIFHLLVLN